MRIKRVTDSIRRGEHVELYLVLGVSIVAIVLAMLNIGSAKLIAALTVTAVGLLGLSLLEQRFSLADNVTRLERVVAGARFEDGTPYDLNDVLSTRSLVIIAGVDLARTFSTYQDKLEQFLKEGHELRILLYDPDSFAVDYAVTRSKRPFAKTRQARLINDAVADFKQLESIGKSRLNIRLSAAPFPQGMVAADYHSSDGFICLKHYAYRLDNYDRPWMRVTGADGKWYRQYAQEIDAFWQDARQV